MPPLKTNLTTEQICAAAAIDAEEPLPEPGDYLLRLYGDGLFPEAVRFAAHSQTPHECIEWATKCLPSLQRPARSREQEAALKQVQTWLANPAEEQRRAAKEQAEASGLDTPDGTLAMAVFFSGGSITPSSAPDVPPPPHTCQKFVAGAVTLAVVGHQPEQAAERFRTVLALRWPDIHLKSVGK